MLLSIDTATRVLSLALYDGLTVRAEMSWVTANHHTTELTPGIQQLLKVGQSTLSDIAVLSVAQGPGSFNGLRVGISAAKGIALALHVPLIAVPTLDIVAAAQGPFDGPLIAVAQAGRGRVCAAAYTWSASGWQIDAQEEVRIVSWEALLADITQPTCIAGEIDEVGQQQIARSHKSIRLASPAASLRRAGYLAELAWKRWKTGAFGEASDVVPFYLHQPGVPHP